MPGISIRVPVTNVSLVDLTVTLETSVASKDALIEPFRTASTRQPGLEATTTPCLRGVLDVSDEKLVSSDYLSTSFSCVIDVDATVMLNERTAKIVAWYDNEYGFSSRSESGCDGRSVRMVADGSVRLGRVHGGARSLDLARRIDR
jgi:glyceraldehyde 3-phosphate dehydrogenase